MRWTRGTLATGIVALLVSGGLVTVTAPAAHAAAASVVVDAASDLGPLDNPAWYHNQNPTPLPAGDLAQIDDIGPARVVRVWAKPAEYYDEVHGTYDFSAHHDYFDSAAGHADQLYANFDQCDAALMDLAAPQTCREVLKAGIRHYKQRYPMLRYVEVFNEPDKTWTPQDHEAPPLAVDDYYEWYKIAYAVVNEVNAELRPDLPILVGGPVTYQFNGAYLRAFLTRFAADTDEAKALDFLSYHEYGRRANPADVRTAKATLAGWLGSRGLDPETPVVVSEYGVFPGKATDSSGHGPGTEAEDMLTQSAAMATLGIFYVDGGTDMPMHWVYNHGNNERKSMFVDGAPGSVRPYYNVVRMQRMLKERRIRATSSGLDANGIGVNALATRDSSGIAVLATNYQWTTGVASHDVTLGVLNLPAEFAGEKIRLERYLVDATTPSGAALQRIEQRVLPAGGSASGSFTLTPNATTLVVLTPLVRQMEAEDLPTVASTGDLAQSISDTVASGGRLSKLTADGPGDHIRYTVTVPQAGLYRVSARMKDSPDRARAQLAIDGVDQGDPVDGYSTGYSFRDVEFGLVTFGTAGASQFTFTVTGTSGGGWTLGVDQITLQRLPGFVVEAETTTPRISAGDHVYYLTDAGASGGGLVKLGPDAPGDWIRMGIHVPRAGTYRLSLVVKAFPNRGRCQVTVDGVAVGAPIDSYAATSGFKTLLAGTVTFDHTGAATIGCAVTGANPESTGHEVAIDAIRLDA
ncbi:hypothetical protein ACTMTJ_42755 [Phytohabitans sp. LJ34]|uniref:hypothetical protein n=1 Tax=Phytohabitans sp. LJ34 TaxID=3452217 RepID=UPI003F8A8F49